jgi:hypothetical protein
MLNVVASFMSCPSLIHRPTSSLHQQQSSIPRLNRGPLGISIATTFSASELAADRDVIKRVAIQKEGELQVVLEAMKRIEKASKAEKDEAINNAVLQKLTGR